MSHWDDLAADILGAEGVTARYQSASDLEADGVVDKTLPVLFHAGYVGIDNMGQVIADTKIHAKAARASLLDAKFGGLLTVNGAIYSVSKKPEDDGRLWIVLHLEGPIG